MREGVELGLPWGGALAITALSRLLIIPWLVTVVVVDFLVVWIGRYAALSSDRGVTVLLQHGATLLLTSPFIAIALLAALTRWLC
jgi:hypothetical protein